MKVLFMWGPQKVGKMAIGNEIAKNTDYRVIYAHNLMGLHSKLFHIVYGRFLKVEMEIYFQILDELLTSDISGIILPKVRFLNRKGDNQLVDTILGKIRAKNVPIYEVELYADLKARLKRYETQKRLQKKRSKRKSPIPERVLKELEKSNLQVNSSYPFGLVNENYLKIDTSHQTVAETAQQIIDQFHLTPKV